MKLKTVLGYAALAFLLFFMLEDPAGAVHVVSSIGNFLASTARAISSFFSNL